MKASYIAAAFFCVISMPIWAVNPSANPNSSSVIKSTKIDLNKADIKQLRHAVKGIGQKRAEAIIKYRETNHGFKSIEELGKVRGLGESFVKNHLQELKETFTLSQTT